MRLDGVHYPGNDPPMSTAHSKVTAQGQISVPAEIRRKLGIGPGSILEWNAEGEHVIVRKAGRYSSEEIHRALFPTPPKRKSLRDIKKGLGRHVKAKHARR
jgi:AbrB family looped-hinge helix DNA binding protein